MNLKILWKSLDVKKDERSITIITGARGSDLDPSTAGNDGFTAKWGLDATAKPSLDAFTPRHSFPSKVWDGIDVKALLS